MQDVLFVYEISPTTWAYLSALMLTGIFFQFYRIWSMRNIDLLSMIAMAPGLLLIHHAIVHDVPRLIRLGFVWTAGFGIFFLLRLLLDPFLVRRPVVEPNLNRTGIMFTGVALTIAMIASLFLPVPIARLEHLLATEHLPSTEAPGLRAFHFLAGFTNRPDAIPASHAEEESPRSPAEERSPELRTLQVVRTSGEIAANLKNRAEYENEGEYRRNPDDEPDPGTAYGSGNRSGDGSGSGSGGGSGGETIPGTVETGGEASDPRELAVRLESFGHAPSDIPVVPDDPLEEMRREFLNQNDRGGEDAIDGTPLTSGETSITGDGSPANDVDERTGWRKPSVPTQRFIARMLTIVSQIFLLAGIVLIGWLHFGGFSTGIAAATLWLLLPYSGQMAGRLDHSVPGAMILGLLVLYRTPFLAGGLLGLASGLIFYPFFLLPLWIMFYLRRGLWRFLGGVALGGGLTVIAAVLSATETMGIADMLRQMAGVPVFHPEHAFGLWAFYDASYRIPIFSLCVVCIASLSLWPSNRNFGTLLSGTATIMLSCQFWALQEGGLFMAWYFPALILTSLRPNLQDRIALTTVKPVGGARGRG
ncbi:MAG: hypothetical protein Q4C47_06020 [Planctomycetia bacterium]|nr:hypothetical protein [Planctomycetia bacterium]